MFGFLWRASRGYRLTPWRSPYLRWRLETYWGIDARRIDAAGFLRFLWQRKRELWRFLQWAERMRESTS